MSSNTIAKADLGFVLIVEYGDIENKALLLIQSIRRFLNSGAICPIIAVRPRKGREIRESTLKMFKKYDVTYVYKPINHNWRNLPMANQAYGAAIAEKLLQDKVSTLVYLDADIVTVNDPRDIILPEGKDVAVRPVDYSESSVIEFGKTLNEYWKAIFDINPPRIDSLQYCETTVDKIKIVPCFNSGVVAVKPNCGLFQRWMESFEEAYRTEYFRKLSPISLNFKLGEIFRIKRWDIFSKEFFFLDQPLLSSAILSLVPSSRLLILDEKFNHPVIFGDPLKYRWKSTSESIVFLHYHSNFYDLTWKDSISLESETLSWLLQRLPLPKEKHHTYFTMREIVSQTLLKFYHYFIHNKK